MPKRIYGYEGLPRVDHDGAERGEHIYYAEDVMRGEYDLPPLREADPLPPEDRLHVLVSGGSMGGLFTALSLTQAGHGFDVFERTSEGRMRERGAGIIAHPEMLGYLERQGIAERDEIATRTDRLQHLDADGGVIDEEDCTIYTTSWDTVYRSLRSELPEGTYHMGRTVAGLEQDDDGVRFRLEDGSEQEGDLAVVAEGYQSSTRQQLLPELSPEYAGYIAWRGVVPETELPSWVLDQFQHIYSIYHAPEFQILVYPVPGVQGAVTEGDRRINFVWYYNVSEPELEDLLTDDEGVQREASLPPGRMREDVRQRQLAIADAELPDVFGHLVRATDEPFIQAIFDFAAPDLVFDRTCLLGDAAFFIRPHMAAGTAHAAADALELGEALDEHDHTASALREWNESQLEMGRRLVERAERRGDRYTNRL